MLQVEKHPGKGLGQRLKEKADEFTTTNLQAPLMIFAAGTMILAILFSLSRGGILAMVLVALLLLVLLPFSKIGKLGCLALFAGLITGYGALLGLDTIVSRFDSLTTPVPIGWRYIWLPCRCSGTIGLQVLASAHTRCCLPCILRAFRPTSSTTGCRSDEYWESQHFVALLVF